MDEDTGKIYKYTPNRVRSVFAQIPGLVLDQTGYLAFSPPAVETSEIVTDQP
jgi:hypothetical protein